MWNAVCSCGMQCAVIRQCCQEELCGCTHSLTAVKNAVDYLPTTIVESSVVKFSRKSDRNFWLLRRETVNRAML